MRGQAALQALGTGALLGTPNERLVDGEGVHVAGSADLAGELDRRLAETTARSATAGPSPVAAPT
jgi:hypothetical protein